MEHHAKGFNEIPKGCANTVVCERRIQQAGDIDATDYTSTNLILWPTPRKMHWINAVRKAQTKYRNNNLEIGAEVTSTKWHRLSTGRNTKEIPQNLHQMKDANLILGQSTMKWCLSNTGQNALTSFQDDRHQPHSRTKDPDLIQGQKALTLHLGCKGLILEWDDMHRPHDGTTGTNHIQGLRILT